MNDFNRVLEANLTPIFSKSASIAAVDNKDNNRDLFYALVHISEHYDVLPCAYDYLVQSFQSTNEQYTANFSKKYNSNSLNALLKTEAPSQQTVMPETALSDCLVQYAPICFTELGWLSAISQTVTGQTPLVVDLMAVHARLTKGEQGIANIRAIYVAHLLRANIDIPALHTLAFAKQTDVGEEVFNFAAIQLALAQFPRVFFPEILGFTLSYCQSTSLPEQFFPEGKGMTLPGFLQVRTIRRKQEVPQIANIIRNYLAEFEPQADVLWQRVQTGFWLHQQELQQCEHHVSVRLHTILSPRQAVEKLLATLIPNAIGHHGKIRLGAKTLDDWFKEVPFKSTNFLATLLHSPYVDRAKPENSQLLKLFDFGSPMFGVLDEQGKAVFKDWLLSELSPGLTQGKKHNLAKQKMGLKSISSELTENRLPSAHSQIRQTRPINYSKLSNRELYYYLVNNDIYPDVLPAAKQKVSRILATTKLFNRPPFRTFTHQAFQDYIKSLYQHEVARYKPLNKQPKLAKQAYVWGIEQFAPTILTDGCWLQGIHQLDYYSSHAIAALLHKIYADETGDGKLTQNHPHIYQELLDSLAIKLPMINSRDFIEHPGFIGSTFDIPVYLMAISKFPSAFLPELLGLNMAIEISGLGRVYLRLSEELRFWGINSAIVDIHTSIDNLSSGHSALAIKAIQTYLDEIAANYGEQIMQAHWRRIYTGYCSLESVSKRFKFSLIGNYLFKRTRANG
ncbi:MAG: iron-containing redox enzyme family protein [Methyloglobulus sp.]|nr:iron-containing redox enzyme family protein [Methyloglobulus sp.]